MKLNESVSDLGLAHEGPEDQYTEAWWASLSAEELHRYVARGFAGGDVFYAAVAETNRREWELREREREAAAAEAESHEKAQKQKAIRAALTAGGILAVAVAATFLVV